MEDTQNDEVTTRRDAEAEARQKPGAARRAPAGPAPHRFHRTIQGTRGGFLVFKRSYTAQIAFDLVRLNPGRFPRGAADVRLTRGVSIGAHAVTQDLYEAVMGTNPSHFKGAGRPVEKVSWYDAVRFCNTLSAACGLRPPYTIGSGRKPSVSCDFRAHGFRLPTGAEWQFAARAGQSVKFAGSDDYDEVGWYRDNSGRETHPVGQKKPNAWGLYDMSGNVWEWCWDWYGDDPKRHQVDPLGPESGLDRELRGGCWSSFKIAGWVNARFSRDPGLRAFDIGFRMVLPVAPTGPST